MKIRKVLYLSPSIKVKAESICKVTHVVKNLFFSWCTTPCKGCTFECLKTSSVRETLGPERELGLGRKIRLTHPEIFLKNVPSSDSRLLLYLKNVIGRSILGTCQSKIYLHSDRLLPF